MKQIPASLKQFPVAALATLALLAGAAHPAAADPVAVAVHAAPSLQSGTWLNGAPTTLAAQKGKVVVLLFWTRACINCKHNLGYWNDWAKKYRGTDVAVLSVHTPETPGEHSIPSVRRFVAQRGLAFPVLVDNKSQTWNAFGIESWPTEVLIDKQGREVAKYEGELNWQGSGEYKQVGARIESLRGAQTASAATR